MFSIKRKVNIKGFNYTILKYFMNYLSNGRIDNE